MIKRALSTGLQTTAVSNTLFCTENHSVMFWVIHMRYIWNDRTDVAIFSNELVQKIVRYALRAKVTRTTNTIHHFATHNMSRVYIAKISNSIAVFMAMTPIRRAIPGLLEISCGRRMIFFTIFINIRIETFQPIWRRT